MKTSERKQKGRRLQQWVANKLIFHFPGLTENDVRSTSMGAAGDDILLSEKALKYFPYHVECKNDEKKSVWSAMSQCEARADIHAPLVIMKKNYKKPLLVVNAEEALEKMGIAAKTIDVFEFMIKRYQAYLAASKQEKDFDKFVKEYDDGFKNTR